MGDMTGVILLELACELTEAEVLLRGDELARAEIALGRLVGAKKSAIAGFKAQSEELEATIAKLARVVAEKSENRQVECKLEPDNNAAVMKTIRLDTAEVISSRPMTERERQVRLFGGPTPEEAAEQAAIDSQVDEVLADPPLCEACKQAADYFIHEEPYERPVERDGVTGTTHAFQPPAPTEPSDSQAEAGGPEEDDEDDDGPSPAIKTDEATVDSVRRATETGSTGRGKKVH